MSWGRQQRLDTPENADDDSLVPPWKTVAALVVVVACLATVYPTMIHPVIVSKLDIENSGKGRQNINSFTHSTPRPIGVPPGRSVADADRFGNLRSSNGRESFAPFPGPQMDIQAHQQMASTRTNWHWILPFYTIGVVLFLLYTLGKIIFKQPSRNRRQYNFRYDTARECFEVGTNDLLNKTMEDLTTCDNLRSVTTTNAEMERLQKRLLETESAMQKILSQLDTLSKNFDPSTAKSLKRDTEETLRQVENTLKDEETCDADSFNRNGSVDDASSNEEPYIRDLDKAFSDFRKFTDAYLKDKCRSSNERYEVFADVNHSDNDEFEQALSGDDNKSGFSANTELRRRHIELDG